MQSESEQVTLCKERNSFQEARKRDLGKTKDAYFKDLGRQYIRVHSRFEFRVGPSNLSITFTTDQKYTSISSYLLQKLWIKSEKIGHF